MSPDPSPVVTYTAEDIRATGYSSVQDVLEVVPQNFGGGSDGSSQDGLLGPGTNKLNNWSGASSINLRGVGAVGTLVLVNGHRVAPTQFGRGVDISQFPLAAVERIDVLPDGASAVYGSDAVGGVVNISLRKDFEGAETVIRHNILSDSDRTQTILTQTAGTSWTGGSALASGQYERSSALLGSDRPFAARLRLPYDILPKEESISALVSAQQDIGPDFHLSVDGNYRKLDGFRRTNDTTTLVRNRDYSSESFNVSLGAHANLSSKWEFASSVQYGRTDDVLSETRLYSNRPSRLDTGDRSFESLGVDAVLRGQIGAGRLAPKVAVGSSLRRDRSHLVSVLVNGASRSEKDLKRDVASLFAEASLSLVSEADKLPLVHDLTITGAIRYDDYSDFGGTTNYRLGARLKPTDFLSFRVSYGTSFRAPSFAELAYTTNPPSAFTGTVNSATGTGTTRILIFSDEAGRGFGPETSKSLSAGFDLSIPSMDGLTISANYFHIDYRDRIDFLLPPANVLSAPEYGAALIQFADDAAVASFIGDILARGGFFSENATGIRYAFNSSYQNVARLKTSGFDLSANLKRRLSGGVANLRLSAAIIDTYDLALTDSAPTIRLVNTVENPLRLRLRADAGWSSELFSLNFAVNHAPSYRDTVALQSREVSSWTTFDISARAKLGSLIGLGKADRLGLGVFLKNAFNRYPPYVARTGVNTIDYDTANGSPEGRVLGLELRSTW